MDVDEHKSPAAAASEEEEESRNTGQTSQQRTVDEQQHPDDLKNHVRKTVKHDTTQQNEALLSIDKKAEQDRSDNFRLMDEKAKQGYYADLSGGDGRVLLATNAQEIDQKANQNYYGSLNQDGTVASQTRNPTGNPTRNPVLLEAWGEARGQLTDTQSVGSNQPRPQRQDAHPGAYALAPTGPANHSQTFGTIDYDTNHEPMANPAAGQGNTGLAVATEVQELEGAGDLQQAEEYSGVRNSNSEKHAYTAKVALGIFWLLCLVIGVVLVGTFARQGDDISAMEAADPPIQEEGQSMAPSMAPSMSPLFEQVLTYFPNYTIQALEDPESPQSQALNWLLDDPNLLEYIDLEWRVRQRFALVTMFYSTGGFNNWTNYQHWLSYNHHECLWFDSGSIPFPLPATGDKYFRGEHQNPCHLPNNTTFANSTSGDMILLDSNPSDYSYKQLWLHMNNLEGQLPEEIFWLTSLQTMSLFFNNIYGSISSEIGKLQDLQAAILSFTGVGGTIPTEIGLLSNSLAYFLSEETMLAGTLPSELGGLSRMEVLLLDGNLLSGTLPLELFQLRNLQVLYLNDNPISGTLPSSVGMLSSMEVLWMSNTSMSGALPTEIGRLQEAQLLYFYNSHFTGPIPSELGLCGSLLYVYTNHCLMHGPIPSELGLLSNLLKLNLAANHFSASIPMELGLLSSVRTIEIQNNDLLGPIPSEIAALPSLTHFLAQENQLTGTIPQEVIEILESKATNRLRGFNVSNNLLVDNETTCWVNETFHTSRACLIDVLQYGVYATPVSCYCDCSC